MQYDRPLLKEIKTTFVINVSHLSGEILTLKKDKFLQENNCPIGETNSL